MQCSLMLVVKYLNNVGFARLREFHLVTFMLVFLLIAVKLCHIKSSMFTVSFNAKNTVALHWDDHSTRVSGGKFFKILMVA